MFQPRHRVLLGVSTIAVGGLLLSACSSSSDAQPEPDDSSATLIATTTQVGSLVEQIASCAGGEASVLMGPADDPHQFEASSAQMADMIAADLVIANGLGLESSMQRSLDNAVTDGAEIFELAPELDPIALDAGHGHDHDHGDDDQHNHDHDGDDHAHDAAPEDDHGHDHDHGEFDSHIWMDVSRMADGAELIGERVADITGDEAYIACGAEVAEELRDVDGQMAEILADVEGARLVTDHAAYGYFADRYGVEISGVVIPGGSTDGEPSSQDLADLTQMLQAEEADALVTSKSNTNRMITALADETDGAIPVIELYESAIGAADSEAATYQDAMLYNAQALVEALD